MQSRIRSFDAAGGTSGVGAWRVFSPTTTVNLLALRLELSTDDQPRNQRPALRQPPTPTAAAMAPKKAAANRGQQENVQLGPQAREGTSNTHIQRHQCDHESKSN
jgi:hypothetical protein